MTKTKTRKDVLFEESAKLFVERGYSATSIRGIAERVGIEPSSVYSHIKSKEDLLVKICMDAAHYFVDGMEEILQKKLPVFHTIDLLVDLHIDAIQEAPTTVTVFTDEWKHLPEDILHKFLAMRRGYEENWQKILKEGIKNKALRPMDVKVMSQTLLSSMRWVQTWKRDHKTLEISSIKTNLKHFLKRGLTV